MQQEVGIKVTTSFAQKDGQSLETTLRCMP
jgi:hypothetical protein